MILTGYDYEIHKANERKQAYQKGLKKGILVLVRLYRRQNMSKEEILAEVMKEFSLEKEEAEQYMDECD